MTLNLDNTAEWFKRFAVTYQAEMAMKPYEEGDLPNFMRRVTTLHSYAVPQVENTQGYIQAFQCPFTPNGAIDFGEELYSLQKMKVDVQFTCEDIEQWYDTAYADLFYDNTSDPDNWFFPRYVYNNHIIPSIRENLMNVRWAGERVAPTNGVAGTVVGAVDGLKKVIDDAVLASKITPVVTGAIGASTAVAQVEAFVRSIPYPYYMRRGFNVFCSPSTLDKYVLDHRTKYGAGNGLMNDNFSANIYNTPYRLTALRELVGSDALIFARPQNLLLGRRTGQSELPVIRWDSDLRVLRGLMEFHRFYGVAFWEEFFINDTY